MPPTLIAVHGGIGSGKSAYIRGKEFSLDMIHGHIHPIYDPV